MRRIRGEASALVISLLLIVPAVMPLTPGTEWTTDDVGPVAPLETPSPDRLPRFPGWAPDAWAEGDVEELSMLELAMLLAGATPDSTAEESLHEDLERLDDLPPVYEEVARAMLEGLALAYWHQEMATRYLTDDQLKTLRKAQEQGMDLDAATEERLAPVLARLDQPHVLKAAAALTETGLLVDGIVAGHQALDARTKVADLLSDALGAQTASEAPRLAPATPLDVATSVHALTPLSPLERNALVGQLDGAPDSGLGAVHLVLDALAPIAAGGRESTDLVRLGQAIDTARPTLEMWGAAADARLAWRAEQAPTPRLPNPDADRPPLRIALPDLGVQPPVRPAPTLPDAVASLAEVLGGDLGLAVQEAEEAALWLTPEQSDAIARVLDSAARYTEAEGRVLSTPAPEGLTADAIARWVQDLDDGELPSPASPDGQLLVSAQDHLQAFADAAKALEELLAAAEEIPGTFAPQWSSAHSSDSGVECPEELPEKLRVLDYLALDFCGHDTVWTDQEATMVLIDVGGDDEYLGRHATAPFRAQVGPNANNPDHFVAAPISLLFDLSGNDTYDAEGKACAQAAACPDLDVGAVADTSGNELRHSPVAVLVDWEGGNATATNRFMAGDQAQAYAAPDDRVVPLLVSSGNNQAADPDHALRRGVAVLVERIGSEGALDSTYDAGKRSQSSSLPGPTASGRDQSNTPIRHGSAALVRLVGSGAEATATFTAEDSSQAAAGAELTSLLRFGTAGVAFFINVAGRDAISHDRYTAGAESQGSVQDSRTLLARWERPLAFFADGAGPGSRSDDTYIAGERSRGYGGPPVEGIAQPLDPMGIFFDSMVDATLLDAEVSSLQVSVEPSRTEGSSNDQYNVLDEGHGFSFGFFADMSGLDTYNPDDSEAPHRGATTAQSMDLTGMAPDLEPGDVPTGLQDGPVPRNDAVWQQQSIPLTGVDAAALGDLDRDMVPDVVESFWQEFIGLWGADPDDPDVSPLPVTPRALLDLEGADLFLDTPHGLLLTVGGENHYGSGYRAAIHFDLGGNDIHEGLAGAASATVPGGNPLLSFHLDVGGDDDYVSDLPFNQGFGDVGTGLLFDLDGSDTFVAPHSAQGVGVAGGLGALVAVGSPPPAADRNVFLVDAPPAHGTGQGGGIGVFVATGEHNAAPNGTGPGDGTGLRANPSENQAPAVTDWDFPDAVPAGVPTEISFSAVDPDGDPLRLCFSIEEGASLSCTGWLEPDPDNGKVTHNAPIVWDHVPADGTIGQTALDFPVTLEAQDPGGLTHLVQAGNVTVTNEPPNVGVARGDQEPMVGQPTPFQVPFEHADDLLDPVILFGSPGDLRAWNVTSVDWAARSSGGSASLPQSIGFPVGGVQKADGDEPDHLLDGDPATRLALHYSSQFFHDPIQVVVDFAGPRQVRQLEVAAHRPTTGASTQFELSMLRQGGVLEPVGTFQVVSTSANEPDRAVIELPDFPDIQGLVVRQVLPHGFDPRPELDAQEEPPIRNDRVIFHHVRALGPGAVSEWSLPGQHDVEYRVLDRFGGFNATPFMVDVQPDPDEPQAPDLPPRVAAVTIASRGQVRHASLAAETAYPITVEIQRLVIEPGTGEPSYETLSAPSGEDAEICIDWGDGSSSCEIVAGGDPLRLAESREWLEPGSYQINAAVDSSNVPADLTFEAAEVDVELAFDLRSGGDPLLWLALDPAGERTWFSGTPYLGVVDVAGDDRYTGAIAGPGPGGRSALVVDLAGDDDYLSLAPGTQGFGDFGTAAVLMDFDGDDLYVAPGHAQGAATRLGAGVLIDLGGNDTYNPVSTDHPDIRAGMPDAADAWEGRPDSLAAERGSFGVGAADLVQGAAIDAVGLHITDGGNDVFHAGSHAQGYGAHDRLDYLPSTDNCDKLEEQLDQTTAWIGHLSGFGSQAPPPYPWCLLGLDRGDQGGATGPFGGFTPPGTGFDPLRDLEQGVNAILGGGTPNPCWNNAGGVTVPDHPCIPDSRALADFLDHGPRFGPSLGLHLRLDGAASYHGRSDVQGAAADSGRGFLFDLDGAGLFLAQERSQAHSDRATSALFSSGPAALRLGDQGQAHVEGEIGQGGPEGLEMPMARLVTDGGRDARCDGLACEGGEDLSSPIPRPDIRLTSSTPALSGGTWDIQLSNHAASRVDYEAIAVTTLRGASGACLAEAIAPPVRVEGGSLGPGEKTDLLVDLDAILDDGPVHAAGCLNLIAFARGASATDGWGMDVAQTDLIRPPDLQASDVPDLAAGEVSFQLTTLEPLVARTGPLVQFAFAPSLDGPPSGGFDASPVSGWTPLPTMAGAATQAMWDFPAGVVGEHTLWARTQWPGGTPSAWHELGQTSVLLFEEDVALSALGGTVERPDGRYAAANPVLHAAGPVTHPGGVQAVELRVRDDQGNEVKLVREGSQHGILDAEVDDIGARLTAWQMEVRPESTFSGTLHLQGRVGSVSGGSPVWADWQSLATVNVDDQAPRIIEARSAVGAATNQEVFPVGIFMDLDDPLQAEEDCVATCLGAGIDLDRLSVRMRAPTAVAPLELDDVEESPAGLLTHWTWDGDGIPAEGVYFIEAFARDHVGNQLATFPGVRFVVDREPPEFHEPTVGLPAGQQALKPGDEVMVTAIVLDAGEAGVHEVIATVGGSTDPLMSEEEGVYTGTPTAPDGQGDTVSVVLEAVDAAGNPATWRQEFPFHPTPPTLVNGPEISVRAQSAVVDLETDRDVTVEGRLQAGDTEIVGVGTGGPTEHSLSFIDLDPETEYTLSLALVDAAGWVVDVEQTVTTLPLLDSTLDGLVAPEVVGSGPLEIHATADCPAAVPATVALLVDGEETTTAAEQALDPCDGEVPFTLVFDSTTVPDGDVDMVLTLDDGSRVLTVPFTIQVDNSPPQMQIDLDGATPRNGWYSGLVTAHATAQDATDPVSISHVVGSQASQPGGQVTLRDDGQHQVTFRATDGAVPTNLALVQTTVLIDRTPPVVDAAVSLDPAAAWNTTVPVEVSAQDGDSGVEAYRTRIAGGPWTPWTPDVPEEVRFIEDTPEGAHWIDLEVRDRAGNVATASLSILLDQTPPEVLGMRWAGATEDGDPVLHLVAADRLGGDGKPVGVEAVRFASPDDPDDRSPWMETDGIGTFAVAPERTNGTHTLVQLRDRVENLAEPVASPAIPAPGEPLGDAAEQNLDEDTSDDEIVQDPDVQPLEGHSSEPFVFSAIIRGDPTAVWVEVNGERHPAAPDGPTLAGGGRLYTATVQLAPTALDTPYRYRFVAESQDGITSTALLQGPTVLAVGLAGQDDPDQSGGDRGIPAPLGAAIAALGVAIMLHRRKPQ